MSLLGAINLGDIFVLVFIGLFLGLGFVMIRMAYRQHKQDQQQVKDVAEALGWEHGYGDEMVLDRFGILYDLGYMKGLPHAIKMCDVMEGDLNGRRALVFNCVWSVGNYYSQDWCFYILQDEGDFPELKIVLRRQGMGGSSRVAEGNVELGPEAFRKAYNVQTASERFARQICNPAMIEFLMAHKSFSVEFGGPCVAMVYDSIVRAEEIPERLKRLLELRELIPAHLRGS